MKQYRYSPPEIGFDCWPSGELRLEGIEVTTDPADADLFVCPGPLLLFQNPSDLERFPHMQGREERHVFFDCSDFDTIYTRKNCIFIRCNLKKFMLEAHPNSIAWPWPVEDFAECVQVPESGFQYDISFQGWLSSDCRMKSVASCVDDTSLTPDIAAYPDFCGYIYETDEGVRRRAEFRRSMRESRIALCPESIQGCLPYRFLEAMSAGRVPLLVGSDYNLPFADEIPYDDFILRCSARDASKANAVARTFIKSNTDQQIIEKGRQGRHWFERRLNRNDWPSMMAYAVQKKLGMPVAA